MALLEFALIYLCAVPFMIAAGWLGWTMGMYLYRDLYKEEEKK